MSRLKARKVRHSFGPCQGEGEADTELVAMIGKPLAPEYGELKLSPTWDPLRGHPRFEKLLEEVHPK